eukprot:1873245-Ditylum_brightwellii.AAC.1
MDTGMVDLVWEPRGNKISTRETAKVMKEFYPDTKEEIPLDIPEPRVKEVQINCFVDADHALDCVTRRSQTGIMIYCNRTLIIWYSRRQNTVKSSTFDSEFVALCIAIDLVEGLRYKLRMFGVPLEGEANVFCDNKFVIKNSTISESQLKKMHQAMCWHRAWEAVASSIYLIWHETSETNVADLFTKFLGPQHRKELLSMIFG